MPPKIIVVGAGIIGLSTALQLLDAVPGSDVTIVADKFLRETTSDAAAGVILPSPSFPGVPVHILRKWFEDSYREYDRLVNSEDAGEAGIFNIVGYHLYRQKPEKPRIFNDIVYACVECEGKELQQLPPHYRYALKITTLMVESRRFLPYLTNKLKARGVRFIQRKVASLEEFTGQCDLVMNCTGLASKELLNDDNCFATRGHVLKIEAPWIKRFYLDADKQTADTYILPGCETVTIGGTRQEHNYDTTSRPGERQQIIDRCSQIIPSIRRAKIQRSLVGLRPSRNAIRVEKETLRYPSGSLTVIHNYGHGGNGIALGWGTAKDAVQQARQYLLTTSKL